MTLGGVGRHLDSVTFEQSLSGAEAASTRCGLCFVDRALLNGIQNVVVVPWPSSDVKLMSPCINSTS